MADGDLISRESLLKGIAELKESPWYNFGKHDPKVIRHEYMEAMMHYGYLQRKETVEIIEDLCIKKEPAVQAQTDDILKQIKDFKKCVKSENSDYLTGYLSALSAVEGMLANYDNGWISVKDRLPDEGTEVLIYCPEFLNEIRKAFYTEGDFFVEREDLIIKPAPNGYCTHWQPLPKPPKEDKNETD